MEIPILPETELPGKRVWWNQDTFNLARLFAILRQYNVRIESAEKLVDNLKYELETFKLPDEFGEAIRKAGNEGILDKLIRNYLSIRVFFPKLTYRGNCAIVITGDTATIIDSGAPNEGIVDKIREAVPEGVTVKYLVITHCHNDHIGGVEEINNAYPDIITFIPASPSTYKIIGTPEFIEQCSTRYDDTVNKCNNVRVLGEDVPFEIAPYFNITLYHNMEYCFDESGVYDYTTNPANNLDWEHTDYNGFCMLARISCPSGAILFTGDANPKVLDYMDKFALEFDAMTVPHHDADQITGKLVYNAKPYVAVVQGDTYSPKKASAVLAKNGVMIKSEHQNGNIYLEIKKEVTVTDCNGNQYSNYPVDGFFPFEDIYEVWSNHGSYGDWFIQSGHLPNHMPKGVELTGRLTFEFINREQRGILTFRCRNGNIYEYVVTSNDEGQAEGLGWRKVFDFEHTERIGQYRNINDFFMANIRGNYTIKNGIVYMTVEYKPYAEMNMDEVLAFFEYTPVFPTAFTVTNELGESICLEVFGVETDDTGYIRFKGGRLNNQKYYRGSVAFSID